MRRGMRLSILFKQGGEIIEGSWVLVNGGGDLGTRSVIKRGLLFLVEGAVGQQVRTHITFRFVHF